MRTDATKRLCCTEAITAVGAAEEISDVGDLSRHVLVAFAEREGLAVL